MTDVVETCKQCGAPLKPKRKLKQWCSYACRGQYTFRNDKTYRGARSRFKKLKRNKGLQCDNYGGMGKIGFVPINAVTKRIDTTKKQGAGWLIEVGWVGNRIRWVARVGPYASEPLSLEDAKDAAVDMLKGGFLNKSPLDDPIDHLNRLAAADLAAAVVTADPEIAPPIQAEAIQGDAYELEYYEDGYPNLPECLKT
jgi:ribosomal protein L44E